MNERKAGWWIVTFERGFVVRAQVTKFQPVDAMWTRPAETLEEATQCLPWNTLPDMKIKQFPEDSVPHVEMLDSSGSEKGEIWMAVESTNILDAIIKASGLLSMKKGGH